MWPSNLSNFFYYATQLSYYFTADTEIIPIFKCHRSKLQAFENSWCINYYNGCASPYAIFPCVSPQQDWTWTACPFFSQQIPFGLFDFLCSFHPYFLLYKIPHENFQHTFHVKVIQKVVSHRFFVPCSVCKEH